MSEGKDPAIKLFGKTIQLPETPLTDAVSGDGGCVKSEDLSSSLSSLSEEKSKGERESSDGDDKVITEEKSIDKDEGRAHSMMSEDVTDPTTASVLSENPKTPSPENEPVSKSEEDPNDTEKTTLKKPDKILPCPRCNSMDTKFCYYNNYNVNQPRHFCKNCQRYWTAGGTMRNVPVGAGRRKNKAAAAAVPQFRQITAADELLVKPNGGVLAFGSVSDTPLCESMASVLSIVDKPVGPNGLRKPEPLLIPVPSNDCGPPCLPGGYGPWAYPWNPQMGPPSAFGPPGFPMPFYPAPPYWACPLPGPWNVQWLSPPPIAAAHSGPNSPTLGKHPREETAAEPADEPTEQNGPEKPTEQNGPEKCLWVPKTLRIDDPDEAAKSSIWATLGIKKDGFKAFRSKREEHDDAAKETSTALRANPAALSRSRNFQESS